ncbi:hypothetical protein PENSPDRAFT_595592 [Peniophora sp. CONT]|nr:hypothetical protein PENSPDRAFT_595592 [Peniophora sp. CONT]
MPEHPYAKTRNPVYTPPQTRNVGAPAPKPSASKPNESAYRTQPPVYDAQAAQDVYERSMGSNVTLTHQELLSIAPEVRAKLRLAVSSRRVATEVQPVLENTSEAYALEDIQAEYLPVYEVLPDGGIRVPDVYKQYFKEHSDEAEVPMMVVSKESSAIRELEAVLDNKGSVNCIIDPGSSIISMSEGVCHAFSIPYDNKFKIPMQSANGEIDHTLGLARNVPFKIDSITFYLQVHVIRSPAYDVLWGRPFDVLGETLVQNFRDESQLITVHDPNSSASISIPTKPRSRPRFPNPVSDRSFRPSS